MFNNFYYGKRILITGHTGFKGSWLGLWLRRLGAHVAGFSSDMPSQPCHSEVIGLVDLVEHHYGDIRNFDQLKEIFDAFQPEIVFHLAAQPLVRRSFREPKLTFDTNVGGTVNVLECLRLSRAARVAIMVTSDKCYKNNEWIWGYRENDQLGGDDPYSGSKGCAELLINSYCQSYFNGMGELKVASVRAGNVIGGGDWAEDRIVPDCINAWSQNREVIIRSPRATRPWQHVLEPLSGYLALGMLLGTGIIDSGHAFNFGPNHERIKTVHELITALAKFWENSNYRIVDQGPGNKESRLLNLCCEKAMTMLGWGPVLNFDETVELTSLWYKKYHNDSIGMLELSEEQIRQYCDKARLKKVSWALS